MGRSIALVLSDSTREKTMKTQSVSKTLVLAILLTCIPIVAHARRFSASAAGRRGQSSIDPHHDGHNDGGPPGGIVLNSGPKVERLALFVDPLPIPAVIDTTNATSLISLNADNGNQTISNTEWIGRASAVQQGQDPVIITIGAHDAYWVCCKALVHIIHALKNRNSLIFIVIILTQKRLLTVCYNVEVLLDFPVP